MKSPIRILFIIDNLGYGGAERQVVELCNHIDKNKFEPFICSLSNYVPLSKQILDNEKRFFLIDRKSKYDISIIFRLFSLIKKLKIDIIHSFLFQAEILSRLVGWLSNTQFIIGSERNSYHAYNSVSFLLLKITSPLMTICIANSLAGKIYNQNKYKLPDSRYRIIYNGTNIDRFYPKNVDRLKKTLSINSNDKVVGIFAAYRRQKNHTLFLNAAAKVVKEFPNTHFLIVGSKPSRGSEATDVIQNEILDLVNKLKIHENCIFLNARNDVEELYNLCDCTVLTSFHEGTPNVAIESMACGVPVIATDVSDNKILIPDGKVGFIVPLNDDSYLSEKICDILREKTLREKMALDAQNWVRNHFSYSHMSKNFENAYIDLVVNKSK